MPEQEHYPDIEHHPEIGHDPESEPHSDREHRELMNRYREAVKAYSVAVAEIDDVTGVDLDLARANAKEARLTCEQLRRELEDYDQK